MNTKHQSGNVLFLILIAVALFAALAYAVTSSTRNSGGSVSKDKAKANAAAIVQYATSLKNAVTRMKISNGCTDTTFDFTNPIYKVNNGNGISSANSNAPANKSCHMFDPAGGAMVAVLPPADAINLNHISTATPNVAKPGHGAFQVLQVRGVGTDGASGTESANDIVFWQSYLTKETCLAINDLLGVPNPGGDAPPGTATGSSGTYINGSLSGTKIQDDASLNGLAVACRAGVDETYQFYYVLVER